MWLELSDQTGYCPHFPDSQIVTVNTHRLIPTVTWAIHHKLYKVSRVPQEGISTASRVRHIGLLDHQQISWDFPNDRLLGPYFHSWLVPWRQSYESEWGLLTQWLVLRYKRMATGHMSDRPARITAYSPTLRLCHLTGEGRCCLSCIEQLSSKNKNAWHACWNDHELRC